MQDIKKDLTNYFELPERFHSAENFWSSVFALQIMQLRSLEIPTFKWFEKGTSWGYEPTDMLVLKNCCPDNVVVDANFKLGQNPALLGGIELPIKFQSLRPDITIWGPDQIVIIENKTVGAQFGDKVKQYLDFVDCVRDRGFLAYFYLLISPGYNPMSDWAKLNEGEKWEGLNHLILWEVFLASALEQPNSIVAQCFPQEVLKYCKQTIDYIQAQP